MDSRTPSHPSAPPAGDKPRADHIPLPDFATHYPPQGNPPNGTWIPQPWLDKLKSIQLPPNNPVATLKGCCSISYPGVNQGGMSPDVCSFTAGCHTPTDFFNAPNNTFVVSRPSWEP